ncbi:MULTISPECIES: MFS transporter [Actinomadura]|uniref:MFS transporter n=1 Tax=Actinomadura yumaensis TaxID=111807 RepID=A0ABW2CG33_9ACTN|nr:MFS transporter [Actinomadura sp. J1-007]MWK39922.1 MFS transporter [Actinomadura sp. J1-007]
MATRKWILLVLCGAELLVGVDFAIVNVALPAVQKGLGFSGDGLQWVVTALALPFGGFLLVGGRAADLFGRKRVLVVGLALLTASSLVAGLAVAPWMLVAMRAVQGLGSALVAPAALSLITTAFPEGRERERALGVAGAVLPFGFVAGMVLGGLLTAVSWRATMLVNVPAGALVLLGAVRSLPADRGGSAPRRLDVPGAVSGTAALVALIYGITKIGPTGPFAGEVVVSLAAGAALGVVFLVIEARTPAPLVPLRVLVQRTVWASNVPGLITFAVSVGVIYTLSLYLQRVLACTPWQTGLVFVLMGLASIAAGRLAPRAIARFGPRATLAGGLLVQAAGTVLLVLLSPNATSLAIVLPGCGVIGFGHITSVVAFRTAATAGQPDHEQGLATALTNLAQQIGASVGVAFFTAMAQSTEPAKNAEARLVSGTRDAAVLSAALLCLAALFTVVALRGTSTRSRSQGKATRADRRVPT